MNHISCCQSGYTLGGRYTKETWVLCVCFYFLGAKILVLGEAQVVLSLLGMARK